jgi:hypothetical protein
MIKWIKEKCIFIEIQRERQKRLPETGRPFAFAGAWGNFTGDVDKRSV